MAGKMREKQMLSSLDDDDDLQAASSACRGMSPWGEDSHVAKPLKLRFMSNIEDQVGETAGVKCWQDWIKPTARVTSAQNEMR